MLPTPTEWIIRVSVAGSGHTKTLSLEEMLKNDDFLYGNAIVQSVMIPKSKQVGRDLQN